MVWRGRDKDGVDAVTAAAGMAGARRWTVADEAVRPPSRFGAPDKEQGQRARGRRSSACSRHHWSGRSELRLRKVAVLYSVGALGLSTVREKLR